MTSIYNANNLKKNVREREERERDKYIYDFIIIN